ncbi:SDR family NAD(P)-dependent oxidoreductase [Arthrobacter sp. NPDC058130]|uniref:SDR family NAD(P)-dependent oxidoreductase n=1 Tax=Arthrobacter sp. NPDC058130 TaxID=3346353 RepID=UPI0036ED0B74
MSGDGMLKGKTVLVTGGSRGIGRATVETLHREGAHVVLHYSSAAGDAQAVQENLGDPIRLVQGDLADPGAAARVWAAAEEWNGRVDVLVNNAGAWLESPLDDPLSWAEGWQRNLQLNLQAPADLCREAILHFQRQDGGIIVNVASRSSHRGDDAEHLAYGAAKGGLLALTKGIARGFGRDNVLAYAVAPGWVGTGIASHLTLDADRLSGLPLGEITPPQDVAEVIAFLASGRSRHTTGATVDITGADYVR